MSTLNNECDIPEDFLCPLNLTMMSTPVMSKYGHNFDLWAIMEWLDRGNEVCPLTRQPLTVKGLKHNRNLEARIEAWKEDNAAKLTTHEDDADPSLNKADVNAPVFVPTRTQRVNNVNSKSRMLRTAFKTQRGRGAAGIQTRGIWR